MVDYTYHGSGEVTVSPSKYQTGGSGFSSSGTYRSEAEARSAVSSGTRTGAIQTEQQQRKAKIFASPAAQWSSAEARNEAYISYLRSGGPPVAQLGGVVPTSTMAERRAEASQYQAMQTQAKQISSTPLLTAAMQRTSFDYQYDLGKPISKQEYLAPKSAQKSGEVYAPRFGKMISLEEFYEKHPTPIMKLSGQYEKFEGQVSKKLGIGNFFDRLQTSYKADQAQYQTLFREVSKGKEVRPLPGWFTSSHEAYSEFLTGAAVGIVKKPVTAAVNFAAMGVLTGGSGYAVSKAPWLAKGITAGRIGSKASVVNVGGAALGGVYGADVYQRVSRAESPARTLGSITSTEIVSMAAGGYLGTKLKLPGRGGRGKLYEVSEVTGFEVLGSGKVKGGRVDISSLQQTVKPITKQSFQTFTSAPETITLEGMQFPVKFRTSNKIGIVGAEYAGKGIFSFKKGSIIQGDFGGIKRLPDRLASIADITQYPKIGKVSKVSAYDTFNIEVQKFTKMRGFTPKNKLTGVGEGFTGTIESKTSLNILKPREIIQMERYIPFKKIGTGRKQLTTNMFTEARGKATMRASSSYAGMGDFMKGVKKTYTGKLKIPTAREYELSKIKMPWIASRTAYRAKATLAGIKSPIKKTEFKFDTKTGYWVKHPGTFDKPRADFIRFMKNERGSMYYPRTPAKPVMQRQKAIIPQKRTLQTIPRVLPSIQNLKVAATEVKVMQPVASLSFAAPKVKTKTQTKTTTGTDIYRIAAKPVSQGRVSMGYGIRTGSIPGVNLGIKVKTPQQPKITPSFKVSPGRYPEPAIKPGLTPKTSFKTQFTTKTKTPAQFTPGRMFMDRPILPKIHVKPVKIASHFKVKGVIGRYGRFPEVSRVISARGLLKGLFEEKAKPKRKTGKGKKASSGKGRKASGKGTKRAASKSSRSTKKSNSRKGKKKR